MTNNLAGEMRNTAMALTVNVSGFFQRFRQYFLHRHQAKANSHYRDEDCLDSSFTCFAILFCDVAARFDFGECQKRCET